jgi:hypothetical protein
MKIPRRHPIFSNINTKKTFPPQDDPDTEAKTRTQMFCDSKRDKEKREAELPCPTSAMLAMYSCCFAKTGIKVETENRCIKRQD